MSFAITLLLLSLTFTVKLLRAPAEVGFLSPVMVMVCTVLRGRAANPVMLKVDPDMLHELLARVDAHIGSGLLFVNYGY